MGIGRIYAYYDKQTRNDTGNEGRLREIVPLKPAIKELDRL